MVTSARELHERAIVIDGMGGSAQAFQLQKAGGVTAINVTVAWNQERMEDVLAQVVSYLNLVELFPNDVLIVENISDIREAKRAGKVGIILGTQGLTSIGKGLNWIPILQRIGVRISGLVYNETGVIGSSCAEKSDTGLTYFGRQVVYELNRRGIVIDLSHTGDRTSLDAVELSRHPVVISHSNIRRLVDHPRNAPDDLIKAVAAGGGVIGLTQYGPLLDSGNGSLPTIKDWLEHIRYAVDLVGIDNVGLGMDGFDGMYSWRWWMDYMTQYRELVPARYLEPEFANINTHNIQGYSSNADLRDLTEGLLGLGYSSDDIAKILGLNLLRVFHKVWT
jgi:membrane dipeptidase